MNFLSVFQSLELMSVVARRELTSILRGGAERFLFIWSSLLLVPVVTVAIMAVFLFLRASDVLHPKTVAIAHTSEQNLRSFILGMRSFPEFVVRIDEAPKKLFEQKKCVAYIELSTEGTLVLISRDHSTHTQLSRVVDLARLHAIRQLPLEARPNGLVSAPVIEITSEQYKTESQFLRQVVIGIYVFAYLYCVLWLIPAIDIIRYDFLHNNLQVNLSMPVSMTIIIGGKLISGVVMILIPTVLSGLALVASLAAALAVALEFWDASKVLPLSLLASLRFPLNELLLLPFVVVAAIACLHSWVMMVVIFFQGQRLAVLVSTTSLFVFAQMAVMYGVYAPESIWTDAVPFFGLASLVHRALDGSLSWANIVIAFASTFAITAVMVHKAGRLYGLESWSRQTSNAKRSRYSGILV